MSEMDKKNAAIFVIAGGKSSRMGRDKRWLDLGGRSMLERCLRRIPTVFSERFLMMEANSPDIMRIGGLPYLPTCPFFLFRLLNRCLSV